MTISVIQPSFARGELGPELYGRVDLAAYRVSLRTAINAVIHAYGGASSRPGLRYVGPCSDHDKPPPVLIEFEFNTTDTYILEFGDFYARVVRNDAHVLEPGFAIDNIINSGTSLIVGVTGHDFVDGDDVYVTDVGGITEINNQWFTVANAGVNSFELVDQLDPTVSRDTTTWGAYTSGGTVSKVYEIPTPYSIDQVRKLNHVQSANVMTLVHPAHQPRELSRADHDDWTSEIIKFQPEQDHPSNLTGSGTGENYKVTAVADETEEESLPGLVPAQAISDITNANPAVVTCVAHGFLDEVEINGVVGMTELNGRRFKINVLGSNTFELLGEDTTDYNAYVSDGDCAQTFVKATDTVSWDPVPGARKYTVYREENGLYGFLGETEDTTFTDNNIDPDFSLTPPQARNPFFGEGNYPGVVSYYEQRRVFARTDKQRDTIWYSVTGSQSNMSHSSPRQADDAITATLNSRKVNEVRALVAVSDLLAMTSGSEWRINAGTEGAFSAETLRQKPQSEWGSSDLDPIVVGDIVLYFTSNNSYVRTIGYDISVDGYRGNDMTVFAPHIFKYRRAVDWAFSPWPDPLVHVVREDGWAAALTFEPEQQVVAWSRWNTDGKFKSVAATRPTAESKDYAGFFVVQRKVRGKRAYYIERVASRRFEDVRDCFFVDSGLTLDKPIPVTDVAFADKTIDVTVPNHGLQAGEEFDLSDIVWEPDVNEVFTYTQPNQLNNQRFLAANVTADSVRLVQSYGRLNIRDVTQANPCVVSIDFENTRMEAGDYVALYDIIGMTELNGATYEVLEATETTLTLDVDTTGFTAYESGGSVFLAEPGAELNQYDEGGYLRKAESVIGNLWHLEGREIVLLVDGNVVSDEVVQNGQVDLSDAAVRSGTRIHAGLRFITDIETLNPEIVRGGSTIQGRPVKTPKAVIRFNESRGLLVGPDEERLAVMKQRELEDYNEPTELLTGDKEVDLFSNWNSEGRLFLRQPNPLPLTVTAIVSFLDIGDTFPNSE